MTTTELLQPCCNECRHTPSSPCVRAIECIEFGPLCHEDKGCRERRAARLARARRGGEGILVFLGLGTCGLANGAAAIRKRIEAFLGENRIQASVIDVGCIGYCQKEVIVDIALPNRPRIAYCRRNEESIDVLLSAVLLHGELDNPLALGRHDAAEDALSALPRSAWYLPLARQKKVVLENCGIIDPVSLDAALARGAFRGLSRALSSMTPAEVCETMNTSGLRGAVARDSRPGGSGASPTSDERREIRHLQRRRRRSWGFHGPGGARRGPLHVLEGLAIAAYAIGARHGYLYCRAEYPLAIERLELAIARMREAGSSATTFWTASFLRRPDQTGRRRLRVRRERPSLPASKGARHAASPPAVPAERGLHGKPTVLNNVETLANVPCILDRGAEWYSGIGEGASGTKVFALSGAVRDTGLVECPSGCRCANLSKISAAAPFPVIASRQCRSGGRAADACPQTSSTSPSTTVPCRSAAPSGFRGLVVMDERSCMVDVAKFFMEFIRSESCGKCAPCREGTTRLYEILVSLCEKSGKDENKRLERFRGLLAAEELAETIREASLCGLGQTAANPVLSTLRYFRGSMRRT